LTEHLDSEREREDKDCVRIGPVLLPTAYASHSRDSTLLKPSYVHVRVNISKKRVASLLGMGLGFGVSSLFSKTRSIALCGQLHVAPLRGVAVEATANDGKMEVELDLSV
jgi:hypothetical protein